MELVKEEYIWHVRTGEQIRIWYDPWLPRGTTRRPTSTQGANILTRVSELIDPSTHTWDEDVVKQTFNGVDAKLVLGIPLY